MRLTSVGFMLLDGINWLLYSVREVIETVLPYAEDLGEDKRLCPGNGRGEYIVSSAYRLMSNEDGIAEVH
ncbi:hypothetical protein A2U01_0083960, partial [Trifolium medium]|nr:hypothetical protein [Trifolium medium]